jgi:hypothetical protein
MMIGTLSGLVMITWKFSSCHAKMKNATDTTVKTTITLTRVKKRRK